MTTHFKRECLGNLTIYHDEDGVWSVSENQVWVSALFKSREAVLSWRDNLTEAEELWQKRRDADGVISHDSLLGERIDEIIESLHQAFLAVEPGIWECVKDAAREVEDAPRQRPIKGADGQPLERLGPKPRRRKNSNRGGGSPVPKPPGLQGAAPDPH